VWYNGSITNRNQEEVMAKSDKMALWNAVCTTKEPDMVKRVNARGGFNAIAAQYQRRIASEMWGPYGETWGLKDLEFHFLDKYESVMIIATFYFPGGEFKIAADHGMRRDDDVIKKLQTDVLTKALSYLGFNSDVFEGRFDDNKYVDSLKSAAKSSGKEVQTQMDMEGGADILKLEKRISETSDWQKIEDLGEELGKLYLAKKINKKQAEGLKRKIGLQRAVICNDGLNSSDTMEEANLWIDRARNSATISKTNKNEIAKLWEEVVKNIEGGDAE
jgi:hypothetical protein